MDILWLSALLPDVLLDGFSAASIAHCRDVVAVGPEFASPELCLHFRNFKTGFGGESFDETNDLSSRILWEELAENVDVILIESDLMDVDGESFLDAFEDFEDRIDHLLFQDRSPVFDRDLDVIVALGDVVIPPPDAFGDVDHGAIVRVCCVLLAPKGPALRLRAKRRVTRNIIKGPATSADYAEASGRLIEHSEISA